jgi:hypothetical protein
VLAVVAAAGVLAKPDPHRFISVDRARRSITVTLVAAYDGSNNGFNFDGYSRGELLVSIPLGWRVNVRCTNRAPTRGSCAVVSGSRVAFRGATTGVLRAGGSAGFSFRADRRGTYRLTSLVPGYEQARMWDVLDVGKTPRVELTVRPGP